MPYAVTNIADRRCDINFRLALLASFLRFELIFLLLSLRRLLKTIDRYKRFLAFLKLFTALIVVRIASLIVTEIDIITRSCTFSLQIDFLHLADASQNILNNNIKTCQRNINNRNLNVDVLKRIIHNWLKNLATQDAKLLSIDNNIIQISIKTIQILNKVKNWLTVPLLNMLQLKLALIDSHL